MIDFISPASQGFRMPAEWNRQEGIVLSWPHNPETWPGVMGQVRKAFARFAAVISKYETVLIARGNTQLHEIESLLEKAGAIPTRIRILDVPTNDVWCRDHGPVFVKNRKTGERAAVDFRYNAWGGKFPPWDLDDAVPERISRILGFRRFPIPFVCEGGALEINSLGDLMTTESVLLNPNRNPGLCREDAEAILKSSLGAENIIWLKHGMAGDDTDGHIDTLARFTDDRTVLAAVDETAAGRNRAVLEENLRVLEQAKNGEGRSFRIIPLPLPDPIEPEGWREEVLPATYTNYLLVNGAILIPSYRDEKHDTEACGIIASCFPGRKVETIDCHDIILEGGALHCLSQQLPE